MRISDWSSDVGSSDLRAEIAVDYDAGQAIDVEQHDGSVLRLRKLAADYDPRDRIAAMNLIQQRHARGEVVTGLLHVDAEASALPGPLAPVPVPLNSLDPPNPTPGPAVPYPITATPRIFPFPPLPPRAPPPP